MKRINTLVGITLLGATLGLGAAPAGAVNGLLLKVEVFPGYCHLRIPPIEEQTLSWDHPVLQDASTTDIIDFYGPCDHDPLGREEVQNQRSEKQSYDDDGGDND